jgi:hypothetical protein
MRAIMTTRNPSINTLMELPLSEAMVVLSDKDRVPLSEKIRQLVRKSLELLDERDFEAGVRSRAKGRRGRKSQTSIRRRLNCRRAS